MKEHDRTGICRRWLAGVLAACLVLGPHAFAQVPAPDREVVPGVVEAQLSPQYWIDRLDAADAVILDSDGIAVHNAAMQRLEPSLHDIEGLPVTLEAGQVRSWIERISVRPTRTLYDESGNEGSARAIDKLVAALDLDGIPQTQVTRYAMVVRRADLRTFPTHLRVFSSPDDRDIDRFQESALFPGTPVAVVHRSRDRRWLFVVSQTYAAWIDADAVAFGDKAEIFAYTRRIPFLVVTGARAETVYTPERPEVSNVQLDMGVRVPLAPWPDDEPLNGQHPGFGHAVELPVRQEDGTLAFAPALVPRSADVAHDYLPFTRANLIRQAFKFLGERYGWGHRYNARDCSGFVSEVYRSFGLLIPRNTSDQSRSPGLDRIAMDGIGHDRRLQLLRESRVGDLVYIPGHVMMVLGHEDDDIYVIHDTSGMSLLGEDGQLRRYRLNGVVVTPLLPMMSDATTATVDRITSIQRVRP
ncbi:SH3 domain-containing protein [Luteimonas kalidii]|uniref:SH3 domain-containing protein n=1 Tax=Luteimonas kalidii TaxID=3042025 RepID=A0ABT6JSH7_9GAMM|nr:SH3 domain-containing protein [Luteimonas kalidii]MDH5833549.1 SH3 domain-containing protein [Luteimonas kalidii]